jgi:Protein of unknown function (DUF4235)
MKLLRLFYKPFALVAGLISARLGRRIFQSVWSKIDDAPPPAPTAPGAGLGKVIGAATLEAATMASARAAVDRASARTFHHLIGVWPADTPAAGVAETPPTGAD